MSTLFALKHQLWLRLLFGSFATTDPTLKDQLYGFSTIAFRHLKWLSHDHVQHAQPYDYTRPMDMSIEAHTLAHAMTQICALLLELETHYDPSLALHHRILSDERYIADVIARYEDTTPWRAFDRSRMRAGLDTEQINALSLFLFEESYKEYELILIYLYAQARTRHPLEHSTFQDLIDESQFHLRSFGEMMAQLGILALPRMLHPRTYEISDMESFLRQGILEEEGAKEECRRLSNAVGDPTLARFFALIDAQESYHIDLMQTLLKEIYT